jgi:hypothetical protein
MVRIVDYPRVLEQTKADGLRSLYHNSGAFGFPDAVATTSLGWIGPDDPTIRESARPMIRRIAEPFEANLASATVRAWTTLLPGKVWIMPKSHWSYELQFGSATWLPGELAGLGIDSADLIGRTNAAAIAAETGDAEQTAGLIESLLTNLNGSDFALYFPGGKTVATLHHHKQVWWTTADRAVAAGLDQIVSPA